MPVNSLGYKVQDITFFAMQETNAIVWNQLGDLRFEIDTDTNIQVITNLLEEEL